MWNGSPRRGSDGRGEQVDDKVGGEDSWMEMIKIEPEGKGKLKVVPLTQAGLGRI